MFMMSFQFCGKKRAVAGYGRCSEFRCFRRASCRDTCTQLDLYLRIPRVDRSSRQVNISYGYTVQATFQLLYAQR